MSHPQKQAWLLPSGESEWIILPPNGLARQARLPPSLSSRGKKPKRAFAPLGAVADNACRKEGRGTRERTDRRWGRDDPVARCDNFGVPASAYVSICKSEKGNRRASASSVATMTRGGCKITELANLQGISQRWAPGCVIMRLKVALSCLQWVNKTQLLHPSSLNLGSTF